MDLIPRLTILTTIKLNIPKMFVSSMHPLIRPIDRAQYQKPFPSSIEYWSLEVYPRVNFCSALYSFVAQLVVILRWDLVGTGSSSPGTVSNFFFRMDSVPIIFFLWYNEELSRQLFFCNTLTHTHIFTFH